MFTSRDTIQKKIFILGLIFATLIFGVASVYLQAENTEASEDQYLGQISGSLVRLNAEPLPEGIEVVLISFYGGYYPDQPLAKD